MATSGTIDSEAAVASLQINDNPDQPALPLVDGAVLATALPLPVEQDSEPVTVMQVDEEKSEDPADGLLEDDAEQNASSGEPQVLDSLPEATGRLGNTSPLPMAGFRALQTPIFADAASVARPVARFPEIAIADRQIPSSSTVPSETGFATSTDDASAEITAAFQPFREESTKLLPAVAQRLPEIASEGVESAVTYPTSIRLPADLAREVMRPIALENVATAPADVFNPALKASPAPISTPVEFGSVAQRQSVAAKPEFANVESSVVSGTEMPVDEAEVMSDAPELPVAIRTFMRQTIPANRSSIRGEEKFAAVPSAATDNAKSPRLASDKNFLSAEKEQVAIGSPEVGTSVAKSVPTMPTFLFNQLGSDEATRSHVASSHASVAGVELQANDFTSTAEAPAPVAAHRAVEAVLTAVERFGAGERHSVNLQFSVGGADLAVRVELRADEVRATFRTDSPELRTALAHEWQAVTTDSGDRPFRLAPAVITSNQSDSSALSAFVGDGSSRQREGQARRTANEVFASIASRSRGFGSHAVTEIAAPLARAALLPTSLHLHTHA